MLLFAWRYQMYQKVEGFSHQCEEIAVTILQSSAVCRVSHDVGWPSPSGPCRFTYHGSNWPLMQEETRKNETNQVFLLFNGDEDGCLWQQARTTLTLPPYRTLYTSLQELTTRYIPTWSKSTMYSALKGKESEQVNGCDPTSCPVFPNGAPLREELINPSTPPHHHKPAHVTCFRNSLLKRKTHTG